MALHNRKLKSRGINLSSLAPSCRKEVAYSVRYLTLITTNILTAKSELSNTVDCNFFDFVLADKLTCTERHGSSSFVIEAYCAPFDPN